MNVANSYCIGERAAARQASGECARRKARDEKGRARAGIGNREWRAGLENGYAAEGPAAQQSRLGSRFVFVKRQVVAIADHEAVWPVKVGKASRGRQGGLVVEGGVECGVTRGGRVRGLGKSVRGLEVARIPAASEGGL